MDKIILILSHIAAFGAGVVATLVAQSAIAALVQSVVARYYVQQLFPF
jgi:hypothetical protein